VRRLLEPAFCFTAGSYGTLLLLDISLNSPPQEVHRYRLFAGVAFLVLMLAHVVVQWRERKAVHA
jgi:hypothetical protein